MDPKKSDGGRPPAIPLAFDDALRLAVQVKPPPKGSGKRPKAKKVRR